MLNKSLIDLDVLQALKTNGWDNDRKIDITKQRSYLESSGWIFFEAASRFAESFDGLPMFRRPITVHSVLFDCMRADDTRELVINWELDWGKRVLPIGIKDSLLTIYIDEEKKFNA